MRTARMRLGLVLGILVLIAAGVGGYFVWREKTGPPRLEIEGGVIHTIAGIDHNSPIDPVSGKPCQRFRIHLEEGKWYDFVAYNTETPEVECRLEGPGEGLPAEGMTYRGLGKRFQYDCKVTGIYVLTIAQTYSSWYGLPDLVVWSPDSSGGRLSLADGPVLVEEKLTKADKGMRIISSPGGSVSWEHARLYAVRFPAGRTFRVTVESKEFQPQVEFVSPDYRDREFARSGDARSISEATLEPKHAPEVYLYVKSRNKALGAYSLRIVDTSLAPAESARRITLQDGKASVQGRLLSSDPPDPRHPDRPYRLYAVSLKEGTTYRFELKSDFAGELRLLDAAETEIANGADANRRIDHACRKGGTYLLAVSDFHGRMSRFTLDVSTIP